MKLDCSYYNQGICRSCSEIETAYSDQVRIKEKTLTELLGVSPEKLLPTETSPLQGFRSKAKFVVTGSVDRPVIGLTGLSNLDEGREILNCPLHNPHLNAALPVLKDFIRKANIPPYEIKTKKGELKGLILFISSDSEIYLRLVLRSKEALDRIRKNANLLMSGISELKVISVNIQPIPHALLEGEEEIFITETESVSHHFGKIQSEIHPRGFIQTNSDVARKLYARASEWIQEIHPQRFCELFSGQGAFSFTASAHFSQGLGVEINPDAVERADKTAKENGLSNLRFVARDAAEVETLVSEFNPDVLLVNPPRRGLGEALPMIRNLALPEFIYSSCSAESLARDLISLQDIYEIKRLQIFDMFPHTRHFETLVWLKKI